MGILNLFKTKKVPEEKIKPMLQTIPEIREERKKEVSKSVHDDKNRYQKHILDTRKQVIMVDDRLVEARKENKKLLRMLTVTEKVWLSSRSR